MKSAFELWDCRSFKAASARVDGLFSNKTRAPQFSASLGGHDPVPDVVPVMATVLPSIEGRLLKDFLNACF